MGIDIDIVYPRPLKLCVKYEDTYLEDSYPLEISIWPQNVIYGPHCVSPKMAVRGRSPGRTEAWMKKRF